MKVHIWPTPQEIESDNGIGRVVHAQYKYLPGLGVELVTPDKAEVIVGHTQQHTLPRIDVLHCHGLYWTGEPSSGTYSTWHHTANQKIVEAARRAKIVTVPSEWVAMPFKRDMHISPEVLGHGIQLQEWIPDGVNNGYVLWNKNRSGDVCDPTPAFELAVRRVPVVSTFAPDKAIEIPPNLVVVGKQSHQIMRDFILHADIYLATVRETFGIGTLEALAAGIPVLGYNWGGTADLVSHKETGYLVEPGDIDGLMEGLNWLRHRRKSISENARESASRYDWPKVMRRYLEIYEKSLRPFENSKVSIVIPCYNYAHYLPQAITSALNQTIPCEVIVVDDGSTDKTQEVCKPYGDQIKVIRQSNQGVAAARNLGIREASGSYIVCLDADDYLDPRYAESLSKELDKDLGLGIAYSSLYVVSENGSQEFKGDWPPEFNWEGMAVPHTPPSNCIPSAAMFRKRMWERAGGVRQEYAPAEDTEFWVRGLSLGFTARRITDDPLIFYRSHKDSASHTLKYKPTDTWNPWMRDKQYPMAAPSTKVPNVRSYGSPVVSVIIPVSPSHLNLLPYALDSLIGQTFREWEAIVVWDGDMTSYRGMMDRIKQVYPFATYLTLISAFGGPGACRNMGLAVSKSPLSLFLDADDYLQPSALAEMIAAYARSEGRYIYTDWNSVSLRETTVQLCPEYNPKALLLAGQHAVSVLIDTKEAERIRFDESLRYWEDWDFFARCAINGVPGKHLSRPLVSVRTYAGVRTQRVMGDEEKDKLLDNIRARYTDYAEGAKEMAACGGCGVGGNAVIAAKQAMGSLPPDVPEQSNPSSDKVRMEFIGPQKGEMSYGGPGATPSGAVYRGANNIFNRYADVELKDVDWMIRTGVWKVVNLPPSESETSIPVNAQMPNPPVLILKKKEVVSSIPAIPPSAKRKPGRPPKNSVVTA